MVRWPLWYRLRPSSPYTISSGTNQGAGTRSAAQTRRRVETATSALSERAAPVRGRGTLRRRILAARAEPGGREGPARGGPFATSSGLGLADHRDVERAV